jgi:hypothetical protein
MNWIEIIELRSAGDELEALKQTLTRMVLKADRNGGLQKIALYHNALVETDISIHLQWETGKKTPAKSNLGLRLTSALDEFGRVIHSIWIEDEGEKK